MVRLPYSRTLKRKNELLALEQDLRALLQCQSRQCAFLQSSEYAAVKFNILRALLGNSQSEEEEEDTNIHIVRIPGSTLLMHVSTDANQRRADIVVQSQPFLVAAVGESKEEQETATAAADHPPIHDDTERKRKALQQLCASKRGGSSSNKRSRRSNKPPEDDDES